MIKIYPENPAPKHIKMVIDVLESGGVVILPTDTVYALAASVYQSKAIDKIAQLKGVKKEKANFSFIFNDLSMLSEFTKPFDNTIFRLMRKNLPGPFTFILKANSKVPKIFQNKKKTIGIRIPDNNILTSIIEELGHPLVTTSIHDDDEIVEYTTDPELINERFKDKVDLIVNGGYGDNNASTVVDCTEDEPVIIRQGKGELKF